MIDKLSRERYVMLAVVVAALLLMAGLIVLIWQPAPPNTVVMSTGAEDSAYHGFAQQYRQVLARSGIDLVLKPSAGAVENLDRLRHRRDGVSVALMQGGIAQAGDVQGVASLGGVFFEPVWVFHRADLNVMLLTDLAGKRVAVGAPGSGARQLALEVLGENLVSRPGPVLVEIGGLAAAQALLAGEVDAAILVAAPDAPAVHRLIAAPGIRLFSFRRAEAYTRRLPYLSTLDLPEGAFDLARNIPPNDTKLVAAKASLVVASDMHPVIAELLLDAMREVHSRGGVLWRPGAFPSAEVHEYPLSADAEVYYKTGPSELRRHLPVWTAVWLKRLLFFGLPVIAIGLPLMRFLPGLYRWNVRRRIYRWYGELAFIEHSLTQGNADRDAQRRRLEAIEGRVNGLRVPPAFASEAYTLKMHLQMVRGRLREAGPAAAQSATSTSE